ncbi:MAG: hypothetical protein GTO18_18875 [Anaerolineales bacterium]|nr:hypothetical protein [Anaerolineales bacterium]
MDLSLILDVITAVAVVTGILFGLLQLRHYHLSRKRESALFLLSSFQTGEFFEGVWLIQELPIGFGKNEIEERLGEDIRPVHLVMGTWERIGILVYKREISIERVDEAYSGPIVFSWQRLEKYVADLRTYLQRETHYEWFQWLAERMIDREEAEPPIPAYVAHRDWE